MNMVTGSAERADARPEFETLLVELSTRFINVDSKDVVRDRRRLPLARHRLQIGRE